MITVFRGDDVDITFVFEEINGSPIDLTGCVLFATIKSNINDTDAQAKYSGYLTIVSPETDGTAILSIPAATMIYLRGIYILDIQIKTSTGKIRTPFKADFFVDEDVTIRTT